MCDRTKVEVLARELCIKYWCGKASVNGHESTLKTFTEANWRTYESDANRILKLLEKHD